MTLYVIVINAALKVLHVVCSYVCFYGVQCPCWRSGTELVTMFNSLDTSWSPEKKSQINFAQRLNRECPDALASSKSRSKIHSCPFRHLRQLNGPARGIAFVGFWLICPFQVAAEPFVSGVLCLSLKVVTNSFCQNIHRQKDSSTIPLVCTIISTFKFSFKNIIC